MLGTEKGELIALLDLVKTCVVEAKLGSLAVSYQTTALRSDIDIVGAYTEFSHLVHN